MLHNFCLAIIYPYSSTVLVWRSGSNFPSPVATDGVVATLLRRLPEPEATAFRKVLLVVLLCPVEPLCRKNFSDNRPIQKLLLLLQRFSCRLLLLRGVVVDT